MTATPDERGLERCRCGRALALMDDASDTPKCVGCGFIDELCPCEEEGTEWPTRRA